MPRVKRQYDQKVSIAIIIILYLKHSHIHVHTHTQNRNVHSIRIFHSKISPVTPILLLRFLRHSHTRSTLALPITQVTLKKFNASPFRLLFAVYNRIAKNKKKNKKRKYFQSKKMRKKNRRKLKESYPEVNFPYEAVRNF